MYEPIDSSTFDPKSGRVLGSEMNSCSQMEVREFDDLLWMVSQDGVLHGAMSRSLPNNPVLPYIRTMLLAQFINPEAINVLNLGLGCGSIERYLGHFYPDIKVTTVEISQARVKQTGKYFGLPTSTTIQIQDAIEFVRQDSNSYDTIYCDLFDTRDNFNVPITSEFILQLWKRLSFDGVAVINYALEEQSQLIATLVKLRKAFTATALIEVEGHTNIIILAFKGAEPNHQSIASNLCQFEATHKIRFRKIFDGIKWLPHPKELEK